MSITNELSLKSYKFKSLINDDNLPKLVRREQEDFELFISIANAIVDDI